MISDRVIDENIRLHAEQARDYQILNPQLFNSYSQRRLRREVDFVLDGLNLGVPRIVDLGCGTGLLSSLFFSSADCDIIAVDLSKEMLDIFEDSVLMGGESSVELVKKEAMEFIQESLSKRIGYDVVAVSALLHHLVDVEVFVSTACELVRPGGFLYIAFEPLKQEVKSRTRYFWHRVIRSLDENLFALSLWIRGIASEKKGLADYQLAFGGVDPCSVVGSLGSDFVVSSLSKFCVRRSSFLALVSDRVIKSENSFSLIARRVV